MDTTNETRPERRWTGFERNIILPEGCPDRFVLAKALYALLRAQPTRANDDREMAEKLAAVLGAAEPSNVAILRANIKYENWNQFHGQVWTEDTVHNCLVLDWRAYLRSLNR